MLTITMSSSFCHGQDPKDQPWPSGTLILVVLVFLHIVALHHVGSNNPDGIEIKKNKDADGIPKDGIPFHPYFTIKDSVVVVGFLWIFLFAL